jgi:hypothetical protein
LGVFAAGLLTMSAFAVPAGATAHPSGASLSGGATVSAPAPGTASATATLPPGEAQYDGKVINMSTGLSGTMSCLIPAQGSAQCYDTYQLAKSAAREISSQEIANDAAASGAVSGNLRRAAVAALGAHALGTHDDGPCQGDGTQWLWLFQNSNYGGASVGLQGTDTWWDLRGAGFQKQTSSYINDTACTAWAIQTYDGSGPWLTINPWSYSSYVGNAWNDKITMVYIAG